MLLDGHIPFWYLFSKIKFDLLWVLLISVLFQAIKLFYAQHLPEIPFSLITILGTSISLLLAFKLSQSYERWWEARKVWGAIVNDSRSFVTQLLGFPPSTMLEEPETKKVIIRMGHRQIGWCYSLGQSLRKLDALSVLKGTIDVAEFEEVAAHSNKPLYLLMCHMRDLRWLHGSKALNDFQQIQVESTITRLCDSMGKSERIANTVFPATYRKFIHFFIYLFLIILSMALVETMGFWEIPLLLLIASTFFLIEKTAKHMQDPFTNKPTDTSVTAIARTIEINIRQLLSEQNVPEPLKPEGFYVM